jgi:hypothetical protein
MNAIAEFAGGTTAAMSALGQKRTFALQEAMSALPPKADNASFKV